ncbi:hypothetical protein D3C72_1992910 [compost metagenome]
MELQRVEAAGLGEGGRLAVGRRAEDAHAVDPGGRSGGERAGLIERELPLARCEDEADGVRAELHRQADVLGAGQAADFYARTSHADSPKSER